MQGTSITRSSMSVSLSSIFTSMTFYSILSLQVPSVPVTITAHAPTTVSSHPTVSVRATKSPLHIILLHKLKKTLLLHQALLHVSTAPSRRVTSRWPSTELVSCLVSRDKSDRQSKGTMESAPFHVTEFGEVRANGGENRRRLLKRACSLRLFTMTLEMLLTT
jgi:hypothetical protein